MGTRVIGLNKWIIAAVALMASSCAINHVYLNRGEDGQLGQQKTLDADIESEITGVDAK